MVERIGKAIGGLSLCELEGALRVFGLFWSLSFKCARGEIGFCFVYRYGKQKVNSRTTLGCKALVIAFEFFAHESRHFVGKRARINEVRTSNQLQQPHHDASANVLSVLIADDHRMVGEMVSGFLSASGNFVVELSDNLEKTLELIESGKEYDIIMLDLVMPGMVGTEGIRKVVKACGNASVVLFTSKVDRVTLDYSLGIGVKGVIPKTMPARSLVSALMLIHSGEVFVPTETIGAMLSVEKKVDALSESELYILRLAAKGLTNKEIANDIGMTETSVKMHMRSICIKLKARNRAHAAMIGRDLCLLDPD